MNRQAKREAQEKAEAEIRRATKSLAALDRNGDLKTTQAAITKHIVEGDKIYPTIKKRLSGSAADASFVKTLIRIACATAKRINSTAKVFSLREKMQRQSRTHKEDLSRYIAKHWMVDMVSYAPTFEYFYGAIKLQGMTARRTQKRARMQLEDPALKLVKATEKNIHTDCDQDSTPKEVEAIHEKIKRLTKNKPSGVSFLSAIVDPESYPHTVENIFHTAFLVKEGKVGLTKSATNKAPMIAIASEDVKPRDRVCNQSIFSFSMKDYKKWAALASVTRST